MSLKNRFNIIKETWNIILKQPVFGFEYIYESNISGLTIKIPAVLTFQHISEN